MRRSSTIRHGGQSIIETVVGVIFMIPIVLFLFDVAVLVLGNTANDNLAKQAARAAASATDPASNPPNQGDYQAGERAAGTVISQFQASGFIPQVAFAYCYYNGTSPSTNTVVSVKAETPTNIPAGVQTTITYANLGAPYTGVPGVATQDPGAGNVAVVTAMVVQPPVPFPGIGVARVFFARAVEPIVSIPP